MTTFIQQRSIGTHSFSVQFQVSFSSCFSFSLQLYDIYFVNIYLNILKYIKNLFFCQRIEFVVVVWCLLNCLLLLIILHKFAEMSLSLSLSLCMCVCVCVCVMSTPSDLFNFQIYAKFIDFICQFL